MESEQSRRLAVEVVAVFDGTIVEARHFEDPGAGALRRSTIYQLAGGGVALAVALMVFLIAFATGGSRALDVVAAVLVSGGLVGLVRGLAARVEERRPRDFTIGNGAGALLPLAHAALGSGAFPLLHSTGTGYELLVAEGFGGEVACRGRSIALGEAARLGAPCEAVAGARAIPFLDGMRARVDVGETTFHVRSVPAPPRVPRALRLDYASQRYTGGVFAAVALFLALVFAIPPDAAALSISNHDSGDRFARFVLMPPDEKETPKPAWLTQKDAVKKPGGHARTGKGPSGTAGRKDAPDARKKFALKGDRSVVNPHLAREVAQEMVKTVGVIGILSARTPAMSSIFSRDTTALGSDEMNALGNLVGTQYGDALGTGALGLVGSARGGGCGASGCTATIGLGNLGTIGHGGGGCEGEGCDYGRKVARLKDRTVHQVLPEVSHGVTTVQGSLDKETIRRVIHKHINEVKFCYDQALQLAPELAGKVVVHFAIAPTGLVATSAVQESTMASPDVAQCVSRAVRRWEFPKPPGGGLTIVSYPFAFRTPPPAR